MRFMGTMVVTAAVTVMSGFAQVHERKERQQDRVAEGIKSGQLTAGETARIEGKEAAINKEVRADRAANGGTLTPHEKAAVNRQQDRTSKQIYADKHNAASRGTPKTEVGKRAGKQQDRIAQGVASGNLSAGQTARARRAGRQLDPPRGEGRPHGERREADTGREKKQLNQQQDQESRKIYREKH